MSHLSPETETFSTPPTTPGPSIHQITPSLSRRSSRPSSLHINQTDWASGIVVEDTSPKKRDEASPSPVIAQEQSNTPRVHDIPIPLEEPSLPVYDQPKALNSPCFVHSHLDKGASLTEWLRSKQHALVGATEVGVARSLQNLDTDSNSAGPLSSPDSIAVGSDDEYETDYSASLTKQLAETAIGVREMSKQLGRTRVRTNIQTVLIVTKARDNRLIKLTRELALYLMLKPRPGQKRRLVIYVDNQLRHSRRFDAEGIRRDYPELFIPTPRRRTSSSNSISSLASAGGVGEEPSTQDSGQLRYWTSNMCTQSPHLFDFVVTLGGDGTVLFTSWLFQRIVPPVLSFALGSLGFLTNFDFADHQAVMDSALDSGIRVNLRMRFTCTVYRAVSRVDGKRRKAVKKAETGEIMMKNVEKGGWEAVEGGFAMGDGSGKCGGKDKEIMCFTTRPTETFEVLNDLVVDRGPSPYVSLLELFGDEHHMTTVQADGLTVSTPTGSTAYSLSAGGSLVHPEIPAMLITPICPHTLSFRPMLLPDSMELRICVPYNSRSTAWASFDGRGRVELKQGDHIKVTASKYPFPTVCADKQSTDWFHAISRTLKWNERERQKSFVVVEEERPAKPKERTRRSNTVSGRPKIAAGGAVEEHVDEEEEDSDDDDDTFDIDDSSPEAALTTPPNTRNAREKMIGQEKAYDNLMDGAFQSTHVAKVERRRKSRSRSRSGLQSGVETPSRFAGPQPHIPRRDSRQVGFVPPSSPDHSGSGLWRSEHQSERNDIYSSQPPGGRSRFSRNDGENVNTPTPTTLTHSSLTQARPRGPSHRSRSVDHHHGRRVFAVWGNDESDSNASDGSVDS